MALNSSSNKNFTPTDEELIKSFLYNKIHNNPLPNHINILEQDLFGTTKNPWEIWEEFEARHAYCKKDLYFFTTLRNKSATGKRVVRTIGIGAWEGEDVGKPIKDKDTGQIIGMRKRFRFEKSNTSQDGAWIVHEYILDKSLLNNSSDINQVLCRFRKNLRHDRQNTETRIDQPSNSNVMNDNTKISRKKTKTSNIVGQRKTEVPASEDNPFLLRQYNIYEAGEPSNNGHKDTNVIDRSTVLGLKATIESDNNNAYLKENIDQNPRYQLDSANNNKIEVDKITNQIGYRFNIEKDCETNSNLMNCTELPRRTAITKNVGQDRQRYTIGPSRTATPKPLEGDSAFLRKYNIYEYPREQSNNGHNIANVVNTEPLNREEGLRNILPQNIIVVELEAINTIYKNNNNDPSTRNHLDSGNNEAENNNNDWFEGNKDRRTRNQFESGNNEAEDNNNGFEGNMGRRTRDQFERGNNYAKDIMNKDKDGDINKRKREDFELNMNINDFSRKLLHVNRSLLLREEDVQMLANDVAENLLMEVLGPFGWKKRKENGRKTRITTNKYCNSSIW